MSHNSQSNLLGRATIIVTLLVDVFGASLSGQTMIYNVTVYSNAVVGGDDMEV